jgi:hypothetical protein
MSDVPRDFGTQQKFRVSTFPDEGSEPRWVVVFDAVLDYVVLGIGVLAVGFIAIVAAPLWIPLAGVGWISNRIWKQIHHE